MDNLDITSYSLPLSHSFLPVVACSIMPYAKESSQRMNITNFCRDVTLSQSKQKESSHKLKLISCQHFTHSATSLFSITFRLMYLHVHRLDTYSKPSLRLCSFQSNKSILFWACCGNNEYTSSSYSRIDDERNWSYFSCMKTHTMWIVQWMHYFLQSTVAPGEPRFRNGLHAQDTLLLFRFWHLFKYSMRTFQNKLDIINHVSLWMPNIRRTFYHSLSVRALFVCHWKKSRWFY